jgi:hypothetical protein
MKTAEDPLDQMLQADDGYIEDGGFTARVVSSLPRRRRSWLRPAVLCSATVIGFALLAWLLPPWQQIFVPAAKGGFIIKLSDQSLLALGTLLVVGVSLLWSLVAVLRWEE